MKRTRSVATTYLRKRDERERERGGREGKGGGGRRRGEGMGGREKGEEG